MYKATIIETIIIHKVPPYIRKCTKHANRIKSSGITQKKADELAQTVRNIFKQKSNAKLSLSKDKEKPMPYSGLKAIR